MMKSKDLIAKLQNIVDKYKTVYMWGVFGAPVTEALIASKAEQYPEWYTKQRQAAFRKLIGKGYFGFDCVNVIKGILWGWSGDASRSYGGATYNSNGVPDISANGMMKQFKDVSTDFSKIIEGEAVWTEGHIGIYIGGGKVIECTPKWSNNVQVTACLNIGSIKGMNGRKWNNHGKLPYIEYEKTAPAISKPTQPAKPTQTETKADYATYTVAKGDSLWMIAAKLLKDGSRYKEIRELNGLKSDTIHKGLILKIPIK